MLAFQIEIISNLKILEKPYFAQNLQLAAVTPVHQKKTSIAKKYIWAVLMDFLNAFELWLNFD